MAASRLYTRQLQPRLHEVLADTPVVLPNGPRQAGKTTLVQQFVSAKRRYLTLDDESTLLSARHDPVELVRNLDQAVIDEVQRALDSVSAAAPSLCRAPDGIIAPLRCCALCS